MGLFEALFDFDGNGKVNLDDDLMFMWITQNVFAREKAESDTSDDWLLYLAAAADAEAQEKTKKEEAERKIRHEINEIRRELYAVCLPYKVEKKEEAKEAVKQYTALKTRLFTVTPEDDGTRLYFECIELNHEIEGFISLAEKMYRVFSGEFCDDSDPVATKAAEVAELERKLEQWEAAEPAECCSEAWFAWDEKRQEYEDEIEEKKDELDWDTLFETIEIECRTQRYLNAYEESTKVLEKAQLCVGRLEQLARVGKKIFQEVERISGEQGIALGDAAWELEVAEPDETSPKRESWQKRLDELNQLIKRLDQIDYNW